jgi:hypothetical protein
MSNKKRLKKDTRLFEAAASFAKQLGYHLIGNDKDGHGYILVPEGQYEVPDTQPEWASHGAITITDWGYLAFSTFADLGNWLNVRAAVEAGHLQRLWDQGKEGPKFSDIIQQLVFDGDGAPWRADTTVYGPGPTSPEFEVELGVRLAGWRGNVTRTKPAAGSRMQSSVCWRSRG